MNNAQLVTLSGGLDLRMPSSRHRYTEWEEVETMDGLWSYAKRVGKATVRIAIAPVKGITHFVMETGRGIKTGDIGRILMAPVKGVTHAGAETTRGSLTLIKASGTLMYDYSCPASGILSAGALVPGPQMPFVAGAGVVAGITCGIKTSREGARLAKKQQAEYDKAVLDAIQKGKQPPTADQFIKNKNTTMYMLAGGAVLLGVGVLALT